MTTPPVVNPEYARTLAFYVSRGFVVKRVYTELWEHGAVELEMEIGRPAVGETFARQRHAGCAPPARS